MDVWCTVVCSMEYGNMVIVHYEVRNTIIYWYRYKTENKVCFYLNEFIPEPTIVGTTQKEHK